ncbi:MAG: hypothetical protein J6M15_03840 [Prevotella sp.]|nr:hypothetical protein [Prevotella sp.]
MKKLFQYIGCALLTGLALTACSPDSFDGADQTKIPTVAGQDFTLEVDQEVNQIRVSYPETAGTYPIWIFNGATYSTLNNAGWANAERGTYTVEMKLGNRNGISQGTVKKTFTFNETKANYTSLLNRISGKEWRIDNAEPAHLACGPYGSDGTGWWNAAADEKKDFGVYDDRISFTVESNKGGSFTYNPGADGLTYINIGCTKWDNGGATADFDMPNQIQTSTFEFKRGPWTDAEGQVIDVDYLVLAPNTFFPYISADSQYENPRFRIETLTASKMVLVYENEAGGISWRFIFTSKEGEKKFEGFDANSQYNMWKGITPTMEFYYAPGWAQIANPEFTDAGNDYTIVLPQATTDQWQAQVKFHTDLTTSAANNYDFSAILNSDKDLNGATVKLVLDGDDGVFYFTDRIDLKAGEDYIFWKSDMPGIDMSKVMLVLDFGGCQENTTIDIANIVLKEHGCDDGTKIPEVTPGGDTPAAVMDWDYESGVNLWKAVDDGSLFDAFGYYFADDGWAAIPYEEATHSGDTYEITLPEGLGGSQWQGQFHIDTKLTASASKTYNFYLVMETDADCPGVTFKLTDAGDSNFFIEERVDVPADGFVFKREGVTLKEGTDAEAIRLFFDFGGSPAGTHVKISKIYFEEAVSMNYDDADNLWKSVDDGTNFDAFGYYFADDSWTGIDYTEVVHDGDTYSLTLPEGLGSSQWQGQFHIDTKLTASAAKSYNFQLVLEADSDCPGVTIKLTDAGDSNFFCEGRHDITADEPYVFTLKGATLKEGTDASAIRLFFDFGGSPAGTHVKISKIIFKEA